MNYTRNWLKRNPENFPVASWLLPREARPPLMAFYAFARGADEMADDAHVPAHRRKHNLMALEESLLKGDEKALPEFALAYGRLARAHPVLLTYGRDLLSAFVQDTVKTRYRDYTELIDYCQRSAAPVGRALLYICGEKNADASASDALCNALQILNHIQDCSDDYVNRGRVYLPLDWFTVAGSDVNALAASESDTALKRVLHRALDHCDALLEKAKPLAGTIAQRQVRREVVLIYMLACRLSALLRVRDPLCGKVRVAKPALFWCLMKVLLTV